ncbi:MAG: succinate dehydrogenase cytochrome b subunit [Prosthecobacter sp.]|nr:succinate dehydrogenase cytochrome b subunit [Prosthecobacter sp.]
MSAVLDPLSRFYASSIGKKILVALTGLALVIFVLGHMIGNLLIFVGPDAINEYGHLLQTMLHGAGVWIARAGLLLAVVIHIVATIQLANGNRKARPERYGKQATIVASKASVTMVISGLTILAFIIYHLLHFTAHAGNDYGTYTTVLHGETVHDVYRMVIVGFSWWPATIFYLIAMGLLTTHLSHGVSSLFQTLGFATDRSWPMFKAIGLAFALLILIGNCSIPIAIQIFHYGR